MIQDNNSHNIKTKEDKVRILHPYLGNSFIRILWFVEDRKRRNYSCSSFISLCVFMPMKVVVVASENLQDTGMQEILGLGKQGGTKCRRNNNVGVSHY